MSHVAPFNAPPTPPRAVAVEIESLATDLPTVVSPGLSGVDRLGQAASVPMDSELVGTLYMHQGVVVGAFVLDLPKIRARLIETATDAVRQSGVSVQAVARQSVLATGTLVFNTASTANAMVKRAAWSTGEACVVGAWQLGTWPARSLYRAVWGGAAV